MKQVASEWYTDLAVSGAMNLKESILSTEDNVLKLSESGRLRPDKSNLCIALKCSLLFQGFISIAEFVIFLVVIDSKEGS